MWYDGVGQEAFSEEVMCELRTEVISGAKWRVKHSRQRDQQVEEKAREGLGGAGSDMGERPCMLSNQRG